MLLKNDFSPAELRLIVVLLDHEGKENSIKSKEIEKSLSLKGSQVRELVHLLRIKGVPVGSGQTGYFLCGNEEEQIHTINQLTSRKKQIEAAISGMNHRCYNRLNFRKEILS